MKNDGAGAAIGAFGILAGLVVTLVWACGWVCGADAFPAWILGRAWVVAGCMVFLGAIVSWIEEMQ